MGSTPTHRWRTPTSIDPSLSVPAWGAAAWDLLLAHGSGLAPRPGILDTIRRLLAALRVARSDSDHDCGWRLGPLFGFVEQFHALRRDPSPVLVQA